ncbi:MAG TPA: DNA primase [Thermodesulfovibrionales bacterium]|nr:DNA primase [Thermodesulfovibrionales bacterium]
MKTEKLIDAIRARLDIVDVVSDYIELKRSGQNFKGLCPFHAEKTPSFMVHPEKQIFHCFGCNAGGDSIGFIMKYENVSFPESLKLLAKKAGLDPKEFSSPGRQDDTKEKLVGLLREASKVFAEHLKASKTALSYLKRRGIADDTVRTFSLGYAAKDWHLLSRSLRRKGFSETLILQSGIASSGEKGIYDTFRDRIIFPIADVQGEIIAFGGRVMDESQPKYLNSPDTPLFKKGETLYGLNHAKSGIREKGYALIAEGYFDVILCHQYGFINTVAPLGTALTPGHLQKLKRFTKKTILVFDGDEAGIAAAKRSVPLLLEQGFGAKILLLPEREDPDSFLRKHGAVPFGKLLAASRSVVDFLLGLTGKDKTETVRETLEIISAAGDAIMREDLIRELSERSGIRETVVREEMMRLGKKLGERTRINPSSSRLSVRACSYDEEVLLLSAVIAYPDRLERIAPIVSGCEFRNQSVGDIFSKLISGGGGGSVEALLPSLNDEEKALVTLLTVSPGFDRETVDKNIEDCVRRIKARKDDDRLKQVHERIKQAEISADSEMLNALLPEWQKLIKEAR